MKRSALTTAVALLACFCLSASATDRNARMIDTIGISYSEVNDADVVSLSLWGETALQPEGGPWAILLGGSIGELAGEMDVDGDTWSVGLGIKHYLFPDTSIALKLMYTEVSWNRSYDVRGIEAELVHRFVPAAQPVSPFIRGQVSWQEHGRFSDAAEPGDDTSGVGFEVGGGVDFEANKELSFVTELTVREGDNLYGDLDLSGGWRLFFGMKYYWE